MKRIAVVGAGISGLAAAYFLSRRHHVWLFEKEPRLGGHTHTVMVQPQPPVPWRWTRAFSCTTIARTRISCGSLPSMRTVMRRPP